MSFDSARRIIAMYQQSNEQRISEGVQTAYNEALASIKMSRQH